MSIQVALRHQTRYRYERPVVLSPHEIRLHPAAHCRTPILSYSLNISPGRHFVHWQQDSFGNHVARFVFPEKAAALEITVDLVADMRAVNPFDFFVESYAEYYPFAYRGDLAQDLAPYLAVAENGPRLTQRLAPLRHATGATGTVAFLVELVRGVNRDVGYVVRMQPGIQSCETTLELGSGSCRDSAWLLVQILRHLGLAARFVSGYLIQLAPDVKPLDGPAGLERDFADLHAWAETYVPGAGWIGLDATSGLLCGEGHLPVACTASPAAAAPVSGAVEPCESSFEFSVSIARIHEGPRTTQPYSDNQWHAIEQLGQGKWYPGEPMPRWAIGVYWRVDGAPLWRDPGLIASESSVAEANLNDAWRMARGIADALGLPRGSLIEAYEDPLPLLEKEGRLSFDVDVPHASGAPETDHARILRALEGGTTQVAGIVLPLRARHAAEQPGSRAAWETSPWPLRRARLFLIPGDAAIGNRLPLDSLPARLPGEFDSEPGRGVVRTALTVEVRHGRVHVFLPPLPRTEDFIDLVAVVERVAARLARPVRLEGYPPPYDV